MTKDTEANMPPHTTDEIKGESILLAQMAEQKYLHGLHASLSSPV